MENGNEPAAYMVPITELNEWEKNPRVNDAAVDKVAASIRRFGFGAPIVARKEDSVIIAGHTRIKAARTIEGMTHVPVRYLDISMKEAEALALADNKLGEIAVWEDNMLAALLADLSEEEAVSLGFNEEELEGLLGDIEEQEDYSEFELGFQYQILIEDLTEESQAILFEKLESEGYKCRPLTI